MRRIVLALIAWLAGPKPTRGRIAASTFIVLWLLVQLFGPFDYYAFRRDKYDERFAWRMFSPMRMVHCIPAFLVGGQTEPINKEFHEAWLEIAGRGRMVVLSAMGQKLCAMHPNTDVRLDMTCTNIDGTTDSWGGSDLCKFPDL